MLWSLEFRVVDLECVVLGLRFRVQGMDLRYPCSPRKKKNPFSSSSFLCSHVRKPCPQNCPESLVVGGGCIP